MSLPQPPVLLITDRAQAKATLETVVAEALEAGCRWVLLRDKDLPPDARLALLRRLLDLGRARGATVMVSGLTGDAPVTDAVLHAEAAGLHLSAGGDPAPARAALGPGRLIGVSAHSAAEAHSAARAGADYVTLSPIFETASKPGYGPALGIEGLGAVARALPIPVIALGGVGAANAVSCMAAGGAGIAVMGDIMRAPAPRFAMAQLLAGLAEPPAGVGASLRAVTPRS